MTDPERQRQEGVIKRVLGSMYIGESFHPIGRNEILIPSISRRRLSTCLSFPGLLQQPSTCLRPRALWRPSSLHLFSIQRRRGARRLKLIPSYRETGFQLLRTSCVFHTSRHSARNCSGGKWFRRRVRVPLLCESTYLNISFKVYPMRQRRIVSTEGLSSQRVCRITVLRYLGSLLMAHFIGSLLVTNIWCVLGAILLHRIPRVVF